MERFAKYRKVGRRLEFAAFVIAYLISIIISSCLGISGKKLISSDTAISLSILVVIDLILNYIAIRIADNWYKKNKEQEEKC